MTWSRPERINAARWLGAAAVLIALLPPAAMAKLPAKVILVEDHSDVLVPWIRTGVRGAIVVNVDAHDDCAPITPEQISKLRDRKSVV
jgi:hypothetical protein